jgi:predicted  nucleic acid-binding Zn-ribbon protein
MTDLVVFVTMKHLKDLEERVKKLEAENQELRESVARLETQLSSRNAGDLHIHNHPRKQAWWENLPPGTII